jgi:hypothetical protein
MMTPELDATLKQFLESYRALPDALPFESAIRALYGSQVFKFNSTEPYNSALLVRIHTALTAACNAVKEKPIQRPRPNEVGNDMEGFVIHCLSAEGLKAAPPNTRSGSYKSTGYPDVRIQTDHGTIFLEVKTFASGKGSGKLRSFYLSPSDDPKVWEDGHHLLVGFEMERHEDKYWPTAFEVVDLFGLECGLKAEINSDNDRLYDENRKLL